MTELKELTKNKELVEFVKERYIYFSNADIAEEANKKFELNLTPRDIVRIINTVRKKNPKSIPRKYPKLLRSRLIKRNIINMNGGAGGVV